MVEGAGAETESHTAGEDHSGRPCPSRIGRDAHHDAGRGGRVEAKLVEDTAELRLHALLGRFHCFDHKPWSGGAYVRRILA